MITLSFPYKSRKQCAVWTQMFHAAVLVLCFVMVPSGQSVQFIDSIPRMQWCHSVQHQWVLTDMPKSHGEFDFLINFWSLHAEKPFAIAKFCILAFSCRMLQGPWWVNLHLKSLALEFSTPVYYSFHFMPLGFIIGIPSG